MVWVIGRKENKCVVFVRMIEVLMREEKEECVRESDLW